MDKFLFLKIALFDIWLANDDRNQGNNNLLIRPFEGGFEPVAIDHEKIFNTSILERKIYELAYEDSMLYSGLYHRLLPKSQKTFLLIEEIVASLRPCIQRCYDQLDQILEELPSQWNFPIDTMKSRLDRNIFTKHWIASTEQNFREFAFMCIHN